MKSDDTVATMIEKLSTLPKDWRVFVDSEGSLVAQSPDRKERVYLDYMDFVRRHDV